MSAWRYKTEEGEVGPVSFEELARLVRDGMVREGSHVCREGAMNWEPVWHVPGLLRAAGIVEPGDSPTVEKESGSAARDSLTPALSRRERENTDSLTPPLGSRERDGVNGRAPARGLTKAAVARGLVAGVTGLLAVGFFYRWAWQATTAFPLLPVVVEGELIDCYFPLVGRCTTLECGLLYFDVFAIAAAATWYATGKR